MVCQITLILGNLGENVIKTNTFDINKRLVEIRKANDQSIIPCLQKATKDHISSFSLPFLYVVLCIVGSTITGFFLSCSSAQSTSGNIVVAQ